MKVSRYFLCLTAIFLFFSINNVSASTIWASGVTDNNDKWFDANKDYADDTLLCWAASAANILSWGGWDFGYENADDILDFFDAHTADTRGWMDYAWNFWFDGTEAVLGNTTYFEDSDHEGFFSTQEYADSYYEDMDGGAGVIWDIADLLQDDYGVSVAVRGTMSHAITVWGVDVNDVGVTTGIWVTDSDDSDVPDTDTLQNYNLILGDNDRWYLEDFYGSDAGYIDEIQALKKNPEKTFDFEIPRYTLERLYPEIISPVVFQPINLIDFDRNIFYNSLPPKVVPEPATVLLFGLGLLGLAGVSRRKK